MAFIIMSKNKAFRYKSNKICTGSVWEKPWDANKRNWGRSK